LLTLCRVMGAWIEDADDQRLLDRQVERLSDGRRVAAEDALPVRVGEHRDRRRGSTLVRRDEHPPEVRPRAEHLEEVRGHQSAGGAMWLAVAEHVERPVAELHELIDRPRLSA